jgi:hypothetical protein
MLWQSLDDPPSSAQINAWTRTRSQGRFWFITRAILLSFVWGLPIWLALKVVLWWAFDREMTLSGIEIMPAIAAIVWLNAREKWDGNERLYVAAVNATAIAPGNPPHWPQA